MSKKNIIIMIIMLLVVLLVFIMAMRFDSGYKIKIINNTDMIVTNLELKYKVGTTIQSIPQVEPKKSWEYTIDTSNINGENAVILTYRDNSDNLYEESVIGYLEKGYEGKVDVFINEINENGKLEIEIK
jgi:hypothetical protein